MKLSFKIIGIVTIAAAIASATASEIARKEVMDQGIKALVRKSQVVLDQLEGTRDYVANQGGLQEYIDQVASKFPDGNLSEECRKNVLRRVPIYSSIKVGLDEAERGGYKFRVFSPEPRKKENMATADEMLIFRRFETELGLKELVKENENSVVVYRPVRLSEAQGCLICHGNPDQSPFKNGRDILGFKMENWADKKLHGVFAIISDKSETKAASAGSVANILLFAVVGLVVSVSFAWFVLKKPLHSLREAVDSMDKASSTLTETGHEISNSSQNLSSASTQAAAALEQTSASLEELTSMVKLNTDNALSAKEISANATNAAKQGEEQIHALLDAMKQVSVTAKKVEEITSVIDDIAFQTNLLALNASVEAARAGEHGKGFKVSVLNSEISHASAEQSTGIEQIGKAVAELDKVTQHNAASSEESAAASLELSRQSDQLDALVSRIESVINGSRKAS